MKKKMIGSPDDIRQRNENWLSLDYIKSRKAKWVTPKNAF